ncbi:hypothetical protein [Methylobacterium radiotolerans]|uniref:Putative bacteriophage protein n=1 Tax=Methylobacterium radiotolerans (strain ATCC 27329 / DSM 1819 / JCM 2831 / NBRC 15690 / NCIMB 10815 / 0-1) TaxID=426355 RepID=B1LUH0_METRJ|nr:hypothetical protein [Methylobacterium radiotolerans]ACB23988.1 putative bacteriophage protein [Methylobacterium radiotolerans JCM 2831]GEM97448.1 hypothetical protein MRA01_19880 [Methylobacterium radiotolerans]
MPITSKLTVKDSQLDPFGRAVMRELEKRVVIGIPGDSMHPAEKGEVPISNAALGYLFEHGQPEKNLPARAHLVPGVERIAEEAAARLKAAAAKALTGDLDAPEKALHAIGLLGVSAVQQEITDRAFAPLAERTIKGRLRRGRTGTKPLIDTGAYRRSFQYAIIRHNISHDH